MPWRFPPRCPVFTGSEMTGAHPRAARPMVKEWRACRVGLRPRVKLTKHRDVARLDHQSDLAPHRMDLVLAAMRNIHHDGVGPGAHAVADDAAQEFAPRNGRPNGAGRAAKGARGASNAHVLRANRDASGSGDAVDAIEREAVRDEAA